MSLPDRALYFFIIIVHHSRVLADGYVGLQRQKSVPDALRLFFISSDLSSDLAADDP